MMLKDGYWNRKDLEKSMKDLFEEALKLAEKEYCVIRTVKGWQKNRSDKTGVLELTTSPSYRTPGGMVMLLTSSISLNSLKRYTSLIMAMREP